MCTRIVLWNIIGTHDVVNATVLETEAECMIVTSASYSDHSSASGALLSCVFITDSGDVDFSRSSLLVLDRNTSYNYSLLYYGRYRVYVYDIEYDGKLLNGVGYPAKQLSINISRDGCKDQGMSPEHH
jgi:hypothetical protein